MNNATSEWPDYNEPSSRTWQSILRRKVAVLALCPAALLRNASTRHLALSSISRRNCHWMLSLYFIGACLRYKLLEPSSSSTCATPSECTIIGYQPTQGILRVLAWRPHAASTAQNIPRVNSSVVGWSLGFKPQLPGSDNRPLSIYIFLAGMIWLFVHAREQLCIVLLTAPLRPEDHKEVIPTCSTCFSSRHSQPHCWRSPLPPAMSSP
jgi:hypothetical protein